MLDHHRHASEKPFEWRFACGQMMPSFSAIWILSALNIIKKNVVRLGPPLAKFSGSAHDLYQFGLTKTFNVDPVCIPDS